MDSAHMYEARVSPYHGELILTLVKEKSLFLLGRQGTGA